MHLKPFTKDNTWSIGFVLTLIALFFFFGFADHFLIRPQGVHFIRQTDGLSFVSNYYHNGFDFFHPGLFNLASFQGRGACEFPILYYLTALLYKLVGEQEFLLKLIHLLIFFTGIFHLFRLGVLLLKDYVFSFLIPLFLFGSVSLMYYSFNYLPDIAALGFSFSGWYFFFLLQNGYSKKNAWFAFICFTLCALLKATYFIHPLAILGLILVKSLFDKKQGQEQKNLGKLIMCGIALSAAIVFAWNYYVHFYNLKNNSNYFTTSIMPIWQLDWQEIKDVWKHIQGEWYKKYLAHTSMHFLFFMFVFILVGWRKLDRSLQMIVGFLVIGSLAYFFLFYIQLKVHDYYFLCFFPLVFFIVLAWAQLILRLISRRWQLYLIKGALFIVVVAGINYSRIKVNERYQQGRDLFSKVGFVLDENKTSINKLNINADAKVIVAPDRSMNGGLYFLQRKGWKINEPKEISNEKIQVYKSAGAQFLFLIKEGEEVDSISIELGEIVFQNDQLAIYNL